MQLIEISQCKIINFKPLRPWPSHLPPICTGNELIAGFQSPLTVAVQPNATFEELLIDCYPTLSLSELARLYALKPNLNWLDICQKYGLRFSSELESIFGILIKTPESFQNWASEKDLGAKDLSILKLSYDSNFLEKIVSLNCSKQIGCKILEWGIELSGQFSWDRILEKSNNTDTWYKDLFQLRYPNTSARDQDFHLRVGQTPWPRQVDAQWKRAGDKAGVEIRFTTVSPADFQQKSEALIKIQNKVDKIWNP